MRSIVQQKWAFLTLLLSLCFSQTNIAQCGYAIDVSAEGQTISGSIFNIDSDGPYTPQIIDWFIESNELYFSTAPNFEFESLESGECTICADYKVTYSNGELCSEIICSSIVIDLCDTQECVWPGDANNDGIANISDVINIGIGFGMTGPARDSVTYSWEAQSAADWDQTDNNGVNYKHYDCNGDGVINFQDIIPVQTNYSLMDFGITQNSVADGVPISMSFDADTIIIEDIEQVYEINGALNFGDTDFPMEDIYGVALSLTYNKHYVSDNNNPVDFDYNNNSFFGTADALPIAKNILDEGQLDIVIAKTNGLNTSGQGRVASVSFIIDADIIDGRTENEGQMFDVYINLIKAIDIDGNEIDISVPETPSGVFFINGVSTSSKEILADNQLSIVPNPADNYLQVQLDNQLHVESIEVLNLVGQRVLSQPTTNHSERLDVSHLTAGMYIVKVQTEEGLGTKRIIIE